MPRRAARRGRRGPSFPRWRRVRKVIPAGGELVEHGVGGQLGHESSSSALQSLESTLSLTRAAPASARPARPRPHVQAPPSCGLEIAGAAHVGHRATIRWCWRSGRGARRRGLPIFFLAPDATRSAGRISECSLRRAACAVAAAGTSRYGRGSSNGSSCPDDRTGWAVVPRSASAGPVTAG
jgi:hypothetical protein